MFFPLDKVAIVGKYRNGHAVETTIVEVHVNRKGGITYVTSDDWSSEKTEKELSFICSGGWQLKRFVKEFDPGDIVFWTDDDGMRRTGIIEKRAYAYNTSRIFYKLDCGFVFHASALRLCKGGL